MIKLLSSTSPADFKPRVPRAAGSKGHPSHRLPGPFVPCGPLGEMAASAEERAADPAKGCREMGKGPMNKPKGSRPAGDAQLGFYPLVGSGGLTVRNIVGDVPLTGT